MFYDQYYHQESELWILGIFIYTVPGWESLRLKWPEPNTGSLVPKFSRDPLRLRGGSNSWYRGLTKVIHDYLELSYKVLVTRFPYMDIIFLSDLYFRGWCLSFVWLFVFLWELRVRPTPHTNHSNIPIFHQMGFLIHWFPDECIRKL